MVWNTSRTDSQQAIVSGISSYAGGNGDLITRTSPDPRAQAHSRASC